MTTIQHTYLCQHFAHTEPYKWVIAEDVKLYHNPVSNACMLTDYSCTDDIGDTEYYTIIRGTLGECLKYVHKMIRRLK
jgi:hypothetical protein